MGAQPKSDARIIELDGLRGLAVILVISKHYGVRLPGWRESGLIASANRVYYSLSGADFFIVLMGFLLGGILFEVAACPNYYRAFFVRRACRVAPLYYLTLIVFALAIILQSSFGLQAQLGLSWPLSTPWSMVAYACYVQNVWMVYDGDLGQPWLMVTWSLAVIEQFYLVLPWLVRNVPRRAVVYVLAGTFVSAPLCRLVLIQLMPRVHPDVLNRLPLCRTDTLSIGVLAALIVRAGKPSWLIACGKSSGGKRRLRWAFGTILIILVTGYALLVGQGDRPEMMIQYVVRDCYLSVIYVMLILMAVFASDGLFGRLLRLRNVRELGRVSYGLFLFHQPVVGVIQALAYGVSAPARTDDWEAAMCAADAFVLTLGLSMLAWRFVEKPFVDWSKSFTYW